MNNNNDTFIKSIKQLLRGLKVENDKENMEIEGRCNFDMRKCLTGLSEGRIEKRAEIRELSEELLERIVKLFM